jgi:hypothetical protein
MRELGPFRGLEKTFTCSDFDVILVVDFKL